MINQLKSYLQKHPALKRSVHGLIFRKKPYDARLRWYVWLWWTLPRYFKRGISWKARLDLVPFHRFIFGKFSRIEKDVIINNGMGDVAFGDEVHTGIGCVIIGPVKLEKHVGLSQYVRILGMHHGIDPRTPHHHQPCTPAPVILEEDAFIGTGTVIMGKKDGSTLTIGKYARVGANSVVVSDIPPYSIAVGNPAKVVKTWDHEKGIWVKVDYPTNLKDMFESIHNNLN